MRFITILILFLLSFSTIAQQKRTISGYVSDAQTGERLYAASVYEQNSGIGTISNRFGFFSLTLKDGLANLKISFVGYQPQTKIISLSADTLLIFSLKSDNKLEEVVVKDRKSVV